MIPPIPDNDGYYDLRDFFRLMRETTANLREMERMQQRMRWQLGEPGEGEYGCPELGKLIEAMNDAQHGWIHSNC
jgi:hypothetical protein